MQSRSRARTIPFTLFTSPRVLGGPERRDPGAALLPRRGPKVTGDIPVAHTPRPSRAIQQL